MTITAGVILGVITGVVAGLLLHALTHVIRTIVIPWYRALVYEGVVISGTWYIESPEYHRRDVTVELEQRADSVSGVSTHVLRNGEKTADRVRAYKVTGHIRDRFLILTGRSTDPTRLGALALFFEIIGDGRKMQGVAAGYSSSQARIISITCVAKRIREHGDR